MMTNSKTTKSSKQSKLDKEPDADDRPGYKGPKTDSLPIVRSKKSAAAIDAENIAKSNNKKTVDDPEDLKDGGADEAAEDGFGKPDKNGNKPNKMKSKAQLAKDKNNGGNGRGVVPPQFLAKMAGRF